MSERPEISLVMPVFNEVASIDELMARCVSTLTKMGRTFEIVAVDDGCSDGSTELLLKHHQAEPRLRIVRLVRNFGQTPALYAGMANARGNIVVIIDADLQNPPEEIPKVINKLEEGYDVVQGWRQMRYDSLWRKTASRMLNLFVSCAIKSKMRDLGCGLKAFRREVVDRMVAFRHHSRYVPAEMVWLGAKVAEVQVEHQPRGAGKSKYSLWNLLHLNFDMLASVTTTPIKLIGWLGIFLSVIGFGMSLRIGYMRITLGLYSELATVAALFFFLAGVQMIAMGLVCEYVSRIFVEVQNKPYYIVKDVIE
ncbi:MAG: glycosyltransferase [Candidatus Hydrogenedentes bacterium]|nr:glycosyltransferase [Candidatus Hydrogenedentota bacterium]